MLTNASEQVRAMNMDRTWETRLRDYESKKAERERQHCEKVVSRQREVAATHTLKLREMVADEEEAKQEMATRMQEHWREQEGAQMSARANAERQAQQYEQHLQATRRREQLMQKMDEVAMVRLKQQQARGGAANTLRIFRYPYLLWDPLLLVNISF